MTKIFDAHVHIIDPQFPLQGNHGFMPAPYTVAQYQQECQALGLEVVGGAVVSGSFQGYDQTYFEGALAQLGPTFVGVTQLPPTVSDAEIMRLDQLGVRALRFNLYRGLSVTLAEIETLAQRAYALAGWATEFYLNLATADDDLLALMLRLPRVSVDHLGMTVTSPATLQRFLAHGVLIRVTGFGRIAYSRVQVQALLPTLYQENPQGLLFGTDLPATRARYRFSLADLDLIATALDHDPQAVARVLRENGEQWYLKVK
jgi:predicted TIM-barrel fold metal-dependent hydrolase